MINKAWNILFMRKNKPDYNNYKNTMTKDNFKTVIMCLTTGKYVTKRIKHIKSVLRKTKNYYFCNSLQEDKLLRQKKDGIGIVI